MAEYAISIEKQTLFNGVQERFSNAYTFDTGIGEEFDDNANITWLVNLEKAVHSTDVTFVMARSYGISGTDITNVMREVRDLSGGGTVSGSFEIYRECAVLIQFELPRSLILRRRRIGRKWLHVGRLPGNGASNAMCNGSAALNGTVKSFYLGEFATKLVTENPPGGGTFASNGDEFSNPSVYDYVNHRQFHRGT